MVTISALKLVIGAITGLTGSFMAGGCLFKELSKGDD